MKINHILLAINVRWWNAEAAYALNLAKGLRREGKSVTLLVNPDSPIHKKAEKIGIPVITDVHLDSPSPLQQYRNYQILKRYIKSQNIQLVNTFKSNGSFLFSLIRKNMPELGYIKTRGDARQPRNNFINRYLYGTGGCDGVIAVGEKVHQWINCIVSLDQSVRTIFYGSERLDDTVAVNRSRVLSDLDIPKLSKVLALVGRTQEVKGHMVLAKAFEKIKCDRTVVLFLVKDFQEFPQVISDLKAFFSARRLENRVRFLGFQDNLASVLSVVDIGIIPSLASEVNCRVAVEFFSAGVPVLAFPTGTLVDIIQHKKTGYLCEDHSVNQLTQGIDWMLQDENRRRRIGQAGKSSFETTYTIEKMTQDTLAFYEGCMAGKRQ